MPADSILLPINPVLFRLGEIPVVRRYVLFLGFCTLASRSSKLLVCFELREPFLTPLAMRFCWFVSSPFT
jgi:hypothetical protein